MKFPFPGRALASAILVIVPVVFGYAVTLSYHASHAVAPDGGSHPAIPDHSPDLMVLNSRSAKSISLQNASRVDFESILQFTIMPQWGAGTTEDDPCVLSFGDTSTTELAVCISGDRQFITLKNDADFEFLPYDFTRPKLYRVTVTVNEGQSEVRIDGETVGSMPMGFGETSLLQLNVGTVDGVSSPFDGLFGQLRIWNTSDIAGIREVQENQPAPSWLAGTPGFTTRYDNLVLYTAAAAVGGQLEYNMPSARVDPVGSWIVGEESSVHRMEFDAPQQSRLPWTGQTLAQGKHGNYTSYKVVQITRDPDGNLVLRADNGGQAGIWRERDWSAPVTFSRVREAQYRARDVPLTQVAEARGSTIGLSSSLKVELDQKYEFIPFERGAALPPAELKQDPWESTFVNPEQIKNYYFSFAGFDITQMDPVNFGDQQGLRAPVFMKPPPESRDYKSTGEGRFSPGSMFFKPVFSTETSNTVDIVTSELELRNASARNLGISVGAEGVGAFKANQSYKKQVDSLRGSTSQKGFGESRILHYALVEDKTKTELHPAFRAALQRLLEHNNDDAEFGRFIERFGTHYPYAITYGGKVHVAFRKTMNKSRQSTDRELGLAAEADGVIEGMKIGGSISTETKSGNTATAENGVEITRTNVIGGRGTGTLESFEVQDTVLPIYMDLRPISELLSPVFFDDPDMTDRLRPLLAAKIAAYRGGKIAPSGPELVRYQIAVSRISCVDDGDSTLSVGVDAFAFHDKLGPLATFLDLFKPIDDLVLTAAGAAGFDTLQMNDQPDVCEVNGLVFAALTDGRSLLDWSTLQPAAPLPFTASVGGAIGAGMSLGSFLEAGEKNGAFWRADGDDGKPLSIAEGSAFAMQPTDDGATLAVAIPPDRLGELSILLSVLMEEVDEVDDVKKDKTVRKINLKLPLAKSVAVPLSPQPGARQVLKAAAKGKCVAGQVWACDTAPFASEVKGEVDVEFTIQRMD